MPVMLYDEELAVEYANRMVEKGVYVVAFSLSCRAERESENPYSGMCQSYERRY